MGTTALRSFRWGLPAVAAMLVVMVGPLVQGVPTASAQAEAEAAAARDLVERAERSFSNLIADPNLGWLRENLDAARAVLVVPRLIKGGFLLGGSGGSGVLIARDPATGDWSPPAFYRLGSVTLGLQVGGEVGEAALLVMSDRGLDSLLASSGKLGANVGVAAGPVGAGAASKSADIVAVSRGKGVYGGITFEGSLVNVRDDLNQAYYGGPVSPREILLNWAASNPHADSLRRTLAAATAPGR